MTRLGFDIEKVVIWPTSECKVEYWTDETNRVATSARPPFRNELSAGIRSRMVLEASEMAAALTVSVSVDSEDASELSSSGAALAPPISPSTCRSKPVKE